MGSIYKSLDLPLFKMTTSADGNPQMREEEMEKQLQREEAERLREQRARISQWEAAADNWALQVKAALLIQVQSRPLRSVPFRLYAPADLLHP